MIVGKSLVLALLLAASGVALPAESDRALQGRGRSSSFQIDVPRGWEVKWTAGTDKSPDQALQVRVFTMAPLISSAKSHSITGFFYMDMVPITARLRWEKLWPGLSTELPRVDGLPGWALSEVEELRTLTAYTQFGNDVLLVHLSAPNAELYTQGKQELIEMLKSYKERVAGNP
jgi:hypothetical protein